MKHSVVSTDLDPGVTNEYSPISDDSGVNVNSSSIESLTPMGLSPSNSQEKYVLIK